MQGSKKEPDIRSTKSTGDSGLSFQALWSSMESRCPNSSFSKNSSFNIGHPTHHFLGTKMLDFSLQDQDSSSTQSTGKSYPRAACIGENDSNTRKMDLSDHNVNHGKPEGEENKFTSSVGAHQDFSPPFQAGYSQPFFQPAITFGDQHFSGVMSSYDPQALVMGVTAARVPLPLDLSTNEPIYVNAKQYRGILRRRQHRAKLEAQNKLLKNRKPYLHESRHQHAVKRARGLGGRFLNKKELQESKLALANGEVHKFSGPYSLNLGGKMSESGVCLQERNREDTSTTCGSEVTNVSTSNGIYHPPEFRFYDYTSRIEESMQGGGGNYL